LIVVHVKGGGARIRERKGPADNAIQTTRKAEEKRPTVAQKSKKTRREGKAIISGKGRKKRVGAQCWSGGEWEAVGGRSTKINNYLLPQKKQRFKSASARPREKKA